jgi:hypothetical protein
LLRDEVSISSVGLSVLCATRARVNNADGKKKKKGIELGDAKTYQKCRSPECGSLAAKRVIPVSAAYKDLKRDFERCLSTIPGPGAHVAQTVYALCHTCAGEQRGWKKKKKRDRVGRCEHTKSAAPPKYGSLAAMRVIPVSAAYKDLKHDFERRLSTI